MKKIIGIILSIAGFASTAGAFFDPNAFSAVKVADERLVVTPSSWVVDLNEIGAGRVSVQSEFAPVAVAPVTFYDGRASTGSISITSNTVLAPATSFLTVSITSNAILAPATAWLLVSVSSNTALNRAVVTFNIGTTSFTFTEGQNWSRNGFNPTAPAADLSSATATSLATALNFSTYGITASTWNISMSGFIPVQASSVVIVRALLAGKYANDWHLTSSTQFALTVRYSTTAVSPAGIFGSTSVTVAFFPGKDAEVLVVTTTGSYRLVAGRDFAIDPISSTATAVNLAIAISSKVYGVTASTSFTSPPPAYLSGRDLSTAISTAPHIVIVRALWSGTGPNAWTISSSTQFAMTVGKSSDVVFSGQAAQLWPGTSNFIEGRNGVVVEVGSRPFVNGVDWFAKQTSSGSAASLSDAIVSVAATSTTVVSTWTISGIVTATMTFVQSQGTYSITNAALSIFVSSNGATALQSGSTVYASGSALGFFSGGFFAQIDTFTDVISTANNFVNGLAVWLSTPDGSSAPPAGTLFSGTTYFVTARTPTSFRLSDTSTGALASPPVSVDVSSRAILGREANKAYKLTPIAFSKAVTSIYQRSNDGIRWSDVSQTSMTVLPATTSTNTLTNLGQEDARYYRFTVPASSETPVSVKSTLNGKR
jgi:hypothetical protein